MKANKLITLVFALVLALGMLGVTALATDVAQVDGTGYETLAAAALAADSGDTIEILDGTWGAEAIGTLSAAENSAVGAKTLTIQPAKNATVTFVSNVVFGVDNSTTRNATMTVKDIAFEDASLLLYGYVRVTVDNCTFAGSGSSIAALYVSDLCDKNPADQTGYPTSLVTITHCTIDGTLTGASGIRVRNPGDVVITGNTVANSGFNGMTIETNSDLNTAVVKTMTLTGNTVEEWNAGNVADGGRGLRLSLGTLASGSTVTVSDNYFIKETLGLDTPDFMKISGVGNGTIDLDDNYWNNKALGEVNGQNTVYTVDGATPTINSVINTAANVAQIGGVGYATLADAIAAVPTTGAKTTITMIDDEELDLNATLTIAANQNVVLDLNGHTVTGIANTKELYFLTNNGTLEITDTSANADGKITAKTTNPDTGYSKENVTVYNQGTLTLTEGTIENTTTAGLAYAVNTSSNAWGVSVVATFNMTGGRITAPHGDAALRIYANTGVNWKVNSINHVNISGGTIVDNGIFFDTFLYTQGQNLEGYTADDISRGAVIDIDVEISGGTINGLVDLKIRHPFNTKMNITGGDFTNSKFRVRKWAGEYGAGASAGSLAEPTDPIVTISGGRFSFVNAASMFNTSTGWTTTSSWTTLAAPYEVTGGKFNLEPTFVADGFKAVANTDADASAFPYVIGTAVANVAQIGGVGYASLADAIAAVPTTGAKTTITMIDDEELDLNATLTIAANQNVVLDLNGHTVTGIANTKELYFLTNNGTLEITDTSANADGKITAKTTNPDTGYSKENVTVYNQGTLTLTEGTIENTTTAGLAYAVNTSSNAWGVSVVATFNMTGGRITAPHGDAALRIYANTGVNWKVNSINHVNISGGTIVDNGIFFDTFLYTQGQNLEGYTADDISRGAVIDIDVEISGGTINGLVDLKIRHPFNTKMNITGGDFTNSKFRVRKWAGEYGAGASAGSLAEPTDPIVTISGGRFSFVNAASMFNTSTGWTTTSSWTTLAAPYEVTGGKFNLEPTFVADGYEAVANTGADAATYPHAVVESVANVAQIGGTGYPTLAEAVSAAANGDTIELLDNVTLTATLNIQKSINIDGNSYTITAAAGTGYYALNVDDNNVGAALTVNISDLTIISTGYQTALLANADYATTVTLSNVDITTDGAAVYSNGRGVIYVNNCDIVRSGKYAAGKDAVYYSALTVGYGGAIEMTNGTITVYGGNGVGTYPSGGTVTLTGVDLTVADDSVTPFAAGYALWSRNEDYTSYPEYCKDSIIVVNSGKIDGTFYITDKYTSGSKNVYDAIISVTGGVFSSDPAAYVAEGYEASANTGADAATYPYAVAPIPENEIVETETSEGFDATYEATKAGDVSVTINVKVENEGANTAAVAELTDIKVADVLDSILTDTTVADNAIVNVVIEIVRSDVDEEEPTPAKVVYEVHPEATVFVNEVNQGTVSIANEDLEDGATFTIKLPVPDALATSGRVKVTHISDDYDSTVGSYEIKGTAGNYYVEITVSHFSRFELEVDSMDTSGAADWGCSLILEDTVAIKLYVENLENAFGSTETDPSRFTVRYTFKGETKSKKLQNASSNEIIVAYCAAKEYTEDVDLELYYDDALIKFTTYSVETYCRDKIEENENEALSNLCYAMLEYGKYAQLRFGYNTDDLPAPQVPIAGWLNGAFAGNTYDYAFSGNTSFVDGLGLSLSLEANTELNLYFTIPDGAFIDDPVVTVNGSTLATARAQLSDGRWQYKAKIAIPAKDLATAFEFGIEFKGESLTVDYSPLVYAYRNRNSSLEGDVCKALALYNQYAVAYFDN